VVGTRPCARRRFSRPDARRKSCLVIIRLDAGDRRFFHHEVGGTYLTWAQALASKCSVITTSIFDPPPLTSRGIPFVTMPVSSRNRDSACL